MTLLTPEHDAELDDRPPGHEELHDEACRWADCGHDGEG